MKHKDPKTFVVVEVWKGGESVSVHGPYREETAQSVAYARQMDYNARRLDVKVLVQEMKP